MMKATFLLTVALLCSVISEAQKRGLSITDTKNWTFLAQGSISDDGNWASYSVWAQEGRSKTLFIQSTTGDWKKEIKDGSDALFSTNGNWVLYKIRDSLFALDLKNKAVTFISTIVNFSIAGDNLLFQKAGEETTMFVRNLLDSKQNEYTSVTSYSLDPTSTKLAIQKTTNESAELNVINLTTGTVVKIWSDKSAKPFNVAWSQNGESLAFLIEQTKASGKQYQLAYYKTGMDGADVISMGEWQTANADLTITGSRVPEFTKDGRFIIFYVQPNQLLKPAPNGVQVNIWSYQDSVIQSQQLREVNKKPVYAVAYNTVNGNIQRVEQTNEKIVQSSSEFLIVEKRLGPSGNFEAGWNQKAQSFFYLVSLNDGSRKLLRANIINHFAAPILSPDGKWAVYYDFSQKNFFSYNTTTRETRNISKTVSTSWRDDDYDYPEPSIRRAYWMNEGNSLLVLDTYDVWQLDPAGIKKPKSITNGFGREHGIRFGVFSSGLFETQGASSRILLTAFNKKNKDNGFFSASVDETMDPELLTMGPYIYQNYDDYMYFDAPVKAKKAEVYFGQRCTATNAPNYFVTKDFRNLRFLTDVQPQKEFNWYTTELYSWKSLDGTILQGILYKPEDFDSTKRYPLIFQYYEQRSHELNLFIRPTPSRHEINIPMFVSSGYLVFVPDIHYTIGQPGRSAYYAVVSAVGYLSKKPWINIKRMGLQGHSFGGFETAYIITHTNLFAAACSAAGLYDMVSKYASGERANASMYLIERNQTRLGGTPWEIPQAYIENSPIYKADKITTPLLMMHNEADVNVPFTQGVTFFNSLRRLGKRAWMLQYNEGDHSVERGKDAEDYHTRMMQFFDHYLKDQPAPEWMLYGIPAKMKGIDDGLQLVEIKDANGKWITPPIGGVLTEAERNKINELQKKKTVIDQSTSKK